MKTTGVVGLVWLVAGVCFGAKLPPSYKKCNRKSSDIDQCLAQALQGVLAELDGPLPEIGLPSVDPLIINQVHVPAKSGSVAVDQKYRNGKLMGFKNSQVKQLKFDFRRKIMEWEIIVAPLTQIAEYELHGRLLLFPVEGTGPSNVSCAPNYKRCDRTAPDVDQCLVQALQGILDEFTKPASEIGLPLMDPLTIPRMSISAGNGGLAVNQEYTNTKLYGLSKTQVNKLKFNFVKNTMELEVFVPDFKMVGMYEVSGTLLMLPVEGTGRGTMILNECVMHMTSSFEISTKKGKKYLKFKNSKLTITPGHVMYNYENLFNGDKALGDNINRVLNENWKEIYGENEDGFEASLTVVMEGVTNSLFGRVPVDEIFMNESR